MYRIDGYSASVFRIACDAFQYARLKSGSSKISVRWSVGIPAFRSLSASREPMPTTLCAGSVVR